jgi:hypothetical protein
MMLALYPFFARLRSLVGLVPALVKKLLGTKPPEEKFAPQRMCPYCGLITSRSKRYCLECGKSFKPA